MSSIAPSTAAVGSGTFTLTATGTNFVTSSVVRWNGSNRTTTFVSSTKLQAQILASDVAATGSASVTVFNPTPGGGTSAARTFTITATNPVPTLSSISPTNVVAGGATFTLTATGSNFAITSVVRWNGSNRTTTFVSSTQLQAQITATDIATAGTASVTVFSPTPGGGTSAAKTFTINNPAPTLSSISPSSAAVGSGAFTLTVTGTNYIAASVVRWKGSNRTTTFVSSTQLQAQIPASDITATGTAAVTVFNPTPGGGTSSSVTFTVTSTNPVPTLSSIAPTSAVAGGAAFTLTATGTNFAITSVVRWNGSNRTTTFVSSTQLQAQITAADIATGGTASVTVFSPTPGGGTSGAQTFTINNPAPTLSSISPNSAVAGGPGFTLTATGANFVTSSVVRWNGSNRTTTFVSSTQLQATISATDIAAAGTASVTVLTSTPGGGTSSAQTFTITAPNPSPTLSSLSPNTAVAGAGAFTLTATGTNFITSSVVRWNGSDRTTTYVSSTQLQAQITAADIATASTASVTVFSPTPGGGTSSAQTFTVNNPAPTLSSISPNGAVAGGAGFTLTTTGTNFVASSVVRWNGSDRSTTFVSSTELQATISVADIATGGTAAVTVFSPAPGGGTSSSQSFTITTPNPSPTLSSLSPNTAVAGDAALTLTVTGTDFITSSVVRWNGADRTTTFASGTQLQAEITVADVATQASNQVTVFNPAPGGGTSNAGTFTVSGPPVGGVINYVYDRLGRLVAVVDQQGNAATYSYDAVGNLLGISRINAVGSVAITVVSTNEGAAGTTVQIFGRGFSTTPSQNTVAFNGTAAVVTDASPNRLVTSVPAGAATGSVSVTTPSGTAASPSPFTVVNVVGALAVTPSTALVVPGRTQQFATTLNGVPTTAVNWAVNGIPGGAPHIGTISTAGLYTAPATSGSVQSMSVTATHVEDATVTASASVVVVVPRPLVSVASMQTAPLLTSLSPASGTPGTVGLSITLQGVGFVGTMSVALLRNNAADANIAVTGFIVVSDTEMTVTVDIASGAATGALVVKVTTSSGASTPLGIAGSNVFTVQ